VTGRALALWMVLDLAAMVAAVLWLVTL